MSAKWNILRASLLWCMAVPLLGHSQGIPEPGLVMYGSITNTNTGRLLLSGTVQWSFTPAAPPVTVTSTLVSVNGKYFYIARVPFETRSIPGVPTLSPSPNTLELLSNPRTYSRSARVNGTNATILSSSRQGSLGTFTFSAADRGAMDRVEVAVNLPGETYEQWSQRIFGSIRPREEDFDGDGATNFVEYIAGTDPKSVDSLFEFVDIRPAPGGGITVIWSSVVEKAYTLERSITVEANYAPIAAATRIPGSPNQTSYTDASATGPGPYFYRVLVE